MSEPPPPRSKGSVRRAAPSERSREEAPPPSEEVRELQFALRAAGFDPGEADGIVGPATSNAVRRFQRAKGLPVDGIAGPQTLAALRQLAEPPATPQTPGSRGPTGETAVEESPTSAAPFGRERRDRGYALVVLLAADADGAAVDRLASAIAGRLLVWKVYSVDQIDAYTAEELSDAAVVVLCLSQAFLASPGIRDEAVERLVARAATGNARLAPVLLESVDVDATPFRSFPALGRAAPLSKTEDEAAWLRSVAQDVEHIIGGGSLPRSYLPRFSADDMKGTDLLERRERIDFLASVLTAKQLETPLAIGLFGDWGSGKSFFMHRLQERIVALTEASAEAAGKHRPSLYCSHIRHVTFNAWLHSGTDIWPAFASRVFGGVAGLETEAPQGATQAAELLQYQAQLRDEIEAAAEDEARDMRITSLEERVAAKRGELAGLGPEGGGPGTTLVRTLREIGARLLGLRTGWRDLRAADVLLVLAVGFVALALALFETPVTWIAAGAAGVLAILRYLDEARRLRSELGALEVELARERTARDERRERIDENVRRELPLLPEFARQEAAEWARRTQLDVVTEIRMKFERLSELIGDGIEARAVAESPPEGAIPIERVIVYVDDLDRCQHDVVVSVLETLKLLLSLPHFVVVVSVDSRWLFRSLQVHFRELLQGDGSTSDAAWAATPQNYLEKIFQYSIVLRPISMAGFSSLIDHLLGPPPPTPATDTAPARAVDGERTSATPVHEGDAARGADADPSAPAISPASVPVADAEPDLTPAELVITRDEIEFIRSLAPMFETPRAVKRLANVYRLLRVSVGADRLLRAESYEPVLLLLAIGIGFPGLAGDVFGAIYARPEMTWPAFVDRLRSVRSEKDLSDLSIYQESLSAADMAAFHKLGGALDDAYDRHLADFNEWIPVVGEFSFHPWQELLPAATHS